MRQTRSYSGQIAAPEPRDDHDRVRQKGPSGAPGEKGTRHRFRWINGPASLRSLALMLPLAVFLCVFFVLPLYHVLKTAVYNDAVKVGMPRTSAAIAAWDGKSAVPDAVRRALLADTAWGEDNREQFGGAVRQLNADHPGFRSLMSKTQRMSGSGASAPALDDIDARWADLTYWRTIKRDAHVLTDANLLAAIDMHRDADGHIVSLPEGISANRAIIGRTFLVSFVVTLVCVVLGVPYGIIAAATTGWRRRLMLTMVLIPLWTSLLVRSAAWVVILQQHGVVNDFLITMGAITKPLQLIYNRTGVLLAMSQVLLPFMVLPVFSAARAVPPNLMRAASSLGARPVSAFVRVLLPLILSGIVSGALLVFMSAIGYYITPTLVGSASDQMISSVIAFYATGTADWGRAAALSVILLAVTMVFYAGYVKVSKANALMGE
ncbi:ABC transporter permease [Robbsia andropogonis]|uniref:ABC transporter permease n=1 Tax=Robbsia andropogonis TaxID=28092 RepID=UPI00209F8AF2|nr:ABC transporter permease [Robbsia andropogonis]MCP1120874.1 ABC transporter permease [Robbsia andropogonis]MCP1130664.1 ABC transporter permease [Robbsia andropogonis]